MQLSDAQKQAVEYLGGAQIILAGAGSGKTRVIVAKAKYLIEQKGYSPESILVITYSRKTQAELEERMAEMGTSAPEIMTFHSLGLDIVNEFSHLLGFRGEVTKADEYRLYRYLMKAIGRTPDSKMLRGHDPGSTYYALQRFIERAKDELVTPSELISRAQKELHDIPGDVALDDDAKIVAEQRWTSVYDASRIYQEYEKIKSSDSDTGVTWIDYGDMMVLAHMLLGTEKIVGATLRQRIKYILVDEFQDANFAQVEMLYHLAANKTGITVVGDDDQAIYRFRGASFGSFKLFKSLFPKAESFKLEENYRSSQRIVNAAQALIEIEPQARFDPNKRMYSNGIDGDKVAIRLCADHQTEAESIADEIVELLKNEKYSQPKSIAVLFRARTHKDLLERILLRRGIEFHYDKKTEEISTPQAKLTLALYEFTIDSRRSDHLSYLMNHFVIGLTASEEREIMYRIGRAEFDPLDILRNMAGDCDEVVSSELMSLADLLAELRALKSEKNPLALLEIIISKTGILSEVIREGTVIDRTALNELAAFLRAAESFVHSGPNYTHADFIEYLNWREGRQDDDIEQEISAPVVLQTVHGAKGLEYPIVFLIGLSNVRFPSRKRGESVEFPPELYKDELPEGDYRIQEERRLFYVAMTRAREKLYLYGVERKGVKRSRFLTELESSPFFGESCEIAQIKAGELPEMEQFGPERARDNLKSVIVPLNENIEGGLAEGLLRLWRVYSSKADSADDLKLLKDQFSRQIQSAYSALKEGIDNEKFEQHRASERYAADRISYTDLEAFDDCPLKFYYRKVLRMPSPPTAPLILGQVIHAVLEYGARKVMDGNPPGLDDLVADFESRWSKIRLADPDQKERIRQRGTELLGEYMKLQGELDGIPIKLEEYFEIELSSAKLVGKIDRVNRSKKGLIIIDYKTGKKGKDKLDDDLQLPIYSLGCKQLFEEYPVDTLYMFLGDGQIHKAAVDPDSLHDVRKLVEDKIAAINESDFAATPGSVCRNCEYAGICPAKVR